MTSSTPVSAENIQFLTSKNSQAAKARLWLYPAVVIGIAISSIGAKPAGLTWGIAGGVLFFIFLVDWFLLRPASKSGVLVAELSQAGITSQRFNTKTKYFAWTDIEAINVISVQSTQVMQLELKGASESRGFRALLNGIDPTKPQLPLAALDPLDQERLLSLAQQQISGVAIGPNIDVDRPTNVLTQERQFQEKLKALAPVTWVTYGLIATNVLIWIATVWAGSDLLKGDTGVLLAWGANSAFEVQQNAWWRLMTATFLHAGVLHLLMNMLGLWSTGITVERIYGHKLFCLIYFGSGLLGAALSLHFSAQKGISVGASGAVFGVAGALLVAVWQHRQDLPKLFGKQTLSGLSFFILYSLMQGLKPGIDNAAHLGGLIAGAGLAFILPERFNLERFVQLAKSRSLVAGAFVLAAVVGVASMAPVSSFDAANMQKNAVAMAAALQSFEREVRNLQKDVEAVKDKRMTSIEADERSRSVHAPRFNAVAVQFRGIKLPERDKRRALVQEYLRMTELFEETLAMDSNVVEGKPEPVDKIRSDAINTKILERQKNIQKILGELNAQSGAKR